MLFDRDNFFGSFLEIGLIAGAFYAGRKMGQREGHQETVQQDNEREIEILKKQVQDLKALSISLMRKNQESN